jgi:aspartate ammonia-lyase
VTNSAKSCKHRIEKDSLGEHQLLVNDLTGIHTARARENFAQPQKCCHQKLFRAMGLVKLAAALTNAHTGAWAESPQKVKAIADAAKEVAEGKLDQWNRTAALQGGAGTSLNMNVNEVIANRALQLLGNEPGDYDEISPLNDINKSQSTNDTVPTALKLATLVLLDSLEERIVELQEELQRLEHEFADVVKVGRTQMQDAVLTTMGRSFSAFAEAVNRDRWRISKCKERLRTVNLGGTAIGSGIGASGRYIYKVVEVLSELSGFPLNRAENMIDNTQNLDVFAEVSGIIKAFAVTVFKISADLRLLSSGPQTGYGELILKPVQAGSSIMPGKVNPVIPEACQQFAMSYMGRDQIITTAAAAGSLELNPFLPLIGENILTGIEELGLAAEVLVKRCLKWISVDAEKCRSGVESSTATLTALVGRLGYEKVVNIKEQAAKNNQTIREYLIDNKILTEREFDAITSASSVLKLGEDDQ